MGTAEYAASRQSVLIFKIQCNKALHIPASTLTCRKYSKYLSAIMESYSPQALTRSGHVLK